MRIVCVSDTHGLQARLDPLPAGDVLVHAGDVCNDGHPDEVLQTLQWLAAQPHRHKIVIAGNHDWPLVRPKGTTRRFEYHGVTYLQDEGVTLDGVRFWGSPWQPTWCDWAFNLPRGADLAAIWARIPDDTNVLVTHSPQAGALDVINGEHVGCADLAARIAQLDALVVHVCGHVHSGYGRLSVDGVEHVNAAMPGEPGGPPNPPVVVDIAVPAARTRRALSQSSAH